MATQQEERIQWTDFETITVGAAALPLTAAKANLADTALLTLDGASARYRMDGTAPTASVGHMMASGDVAVLNGYWEITGFRIIQVSVGSTLTVSYGKRRS